MLSDVSSTAARAQLSPSVCTRAPDRSKTSGDSVATHRLSPLSDTCGQAAGEQRIGYFIYGSALAGVILGSCTTRARAPVQIGGARLAREIWVQRAGVSRHCSRQYRCRAAYVVVVRARACIPASSLQQGSGPAKALVTHRQGKLPPPRAPSHPQGRPSQRPKV